MAVSNSTRSILNAIEVLSKLESKLTSKTKTAEEANIASKARSEVKGLIRLLTDLAEKKQQNDSGSSLSHAKNELSIEASNKRTGQKNKKSC